MRTQPCSLSTFKSLFKILLCHDDKNNHNKTLDYTTSRWLTTVFTLNRAVLLVCAASVCLFFFYLLMAELHSSLWGLLGRECPFVASLHCGDKGVQGSRTLQGRTLDFMGCMSYIWHFLLCPRLETFFTKESTMTKPNQHGERSPATDDIKFFATVLINLTWSFLIYCSFQPFSVLSHISFSFNHTFFLFSYVLCVFLSLILLYAFLLL